MIRHLFRRQIHLKNTDWLRGFSEIHCHLLPGVDDGSQSDEETSELLDSYSELGIKRICITPHVTRSFADNNSDSLHSAFNKLKTSIESQADVPELFLGAEYKTDGGYADQLKRPLLTIGRSNYLLFEFPFIGAPLAMFDHVFAIFAAGARPILAHPERFLYLKPSDYQKLKARGCAFQLNLFSLAGYHGPDVAERASELANAGMYDFTGMDTHRSRTFINTIAQASFCRTKEREIRRLIEANERLFL